MIAALDVAGGEAALLERLRSAPAVLILDNCEHVLDAAAALAVRLLDAAPGLRILATSQVALGVDGEAVLELAPLPLADAVELFARRATARRGEPPEAARELCRALDGLPLAIELAAARTRTLSVAEIARRLDDRFSVLSDPASRKPERRRALRATIGWSYELLFPDDKRGLWALATFAGGAPLPAVEAVLAALDVPASAAIDVIGRLAARSLVIVDGRALPAARQHPRVRARGDGGGRGDRRRPRRPRGLVRRRGRRVHRRRAQRRQAEHLAFARRERANIDAALAWSAAHDPPRALRIANGFGWAWIVLGDSRGAQRLLTALAAAGEAAPATRAGERLLLAAWIEASTGDLELGARGTSASAAGLADGRGPAGALRLLPRLRRLAPRRVGARAGADRAAAPPGWSTPGTRPRTRSSPRARRSRPATASAPPTPATRSSAGCARSTIPWLHVRRDAMLGELARVEHRFDDAVAPHRPRRRDLRPARLPADRGVPAHEPRPRAVPGRRLRDRRGHAASSAIAKAEATGDVRLAALGRVHLGRVLRALGPDRARRARRSRRPPPGTARPAAASRRRSATACWRRSTRADGVAGARARLEALLDAARRDGDAPVEVFALDALGRSDEADRRMAGRRALHHRARPDRRWCSTTNASSPPMTIAMPDRLPVVDDLAEQQVRPHDRERRLRDLGDPDRADLDRLLREHEQPLRRDAAGEREDQREGPAGRAQPEHVAVGERERQHRHRRDRADRRHERRHVHLAAEVLASTTT